MSSFPKQIIKFYSLVISISYPTYLDTNINLVPFLTFAFFTFLIAALREWQSSPLEQSIVKFTFGSFELNQLFKEG